MTKQGGTVAKKVWQVGAVSKCHPPPKAPEWTINKDYMWLDIGKPTKLSHLPYSVLLAQLIATLIHYPCTVVLMGLVDWSAFLELVLPTMSSYDRQWRPWRALDGRHGLIFTPVLARHLLKALQACLGLWIVVLEPIATTNGPVGSFNPPPAAHSPPPPTPLYVQSVILR